MKVLLVNAINPEKILEARYPPLNLAYLASALRSDYDDTIEFKIISTDFENALESFDPDVVGISSVSANYNIAKKYAKISKEKGKTVLIGGVHISAIPKSMTKYMDVGIIGEGERTIVELFQKKFDDLETIKGIVFWKDGRLAATPAREMIENLDTIVMPARDLLDIGKHTFMFTSRGCPYKCIFCCSSRFWKTVRFHSAERVVSEIKILVDKYKVNYIEMFDDLFIADKARLRKIVELMKKEKIKVKIGCSARANIVDDETMKLLKEINVQKIVLGLESGNQRILTFLKGINGNPTVTVEQNYNAVKIANKYGIAVNAGFVIGSPDETEEEIMDTLRLAETSGVNHFEAYVLHPLPGTPMWELAKKKGLVDDVDFDWSKLSAMFGDNHENAIILSDTLSREELYQLYLKFKKVRGKLRMRNAILHPIKNDVFGILKQMVFEKKKLS